MTKVALPNMAASRSIAEKVMSLMDVKLFSFEEWISEKILTGQYRETQIYNRPALQYHCHRCG